MALGPNGKRAVVGNPAGHVELLDLEAEQRLWWRPMHVDRIEGLAFSPDGTRIACVSWDRTLTIVEAETGRVIPLLEQDVAGRAESAPETPRQTAGLDRLAVLRRHKDPEPVLGGVDREAVIDEQCAARDHKGSRQPGAAPQHCDRLSGESGRCFQPRPGPLWAGSAVSGAFLGASGR